MLIVSKWTQKKREKGERNESRMAAGRKQITHILK